MDCGCAQYGSVWDLGFQIGVEAALGSGDGIECVGGLRRRH